MAYRPVSSIHLKPFFISVALPAQAEMHWNSLRPREFTNSKAAAPKDKSANMCKDKHDQPNNFGVRPTQVKGMIALKSTNFIYRVYQKKLNKPEFALRLCKAPQCTKFFIEIGLLGTDDVV